MPLPTKTDAVFVRPTSIQVPEGMTELRHLRTEKSKTVLHAEKAADGKEIRTCEVRMGAVCYRDDDGQLRSIDTTIRDLEGEVGVDWAPYRFRLHSEGIGFDFFSRDGGWVGITLTGIGGEKVDQDTPLKPDIVDNTITFRDVRPGCDIVFKCLNQRVKTLRILRDANAPRTFEWQVDSDKPELVDSTLIGTDAAGNQLELSAVTNGNVITETWVGGDVVYPIEIDPTVTVYPAADGDDGYESSGGWTVGTLALGSIGPGPINAGIRFPAVAIDNGSTVTSSTLGLYVNSVTGTGGAGTIYARADDNPGQFSTGASLPSAVSKTTASTVVSLIGTTGAKSWDVTAIAQEKISSGGWTSGHAIAFPIIGSTSGGNYNIFADYSSGSNIPSLSITYTAAAGGTAANLLLLGCG